MSGLLLSYQRYLHHLHQIPHHLHHNGADKCGKLDVVKCEKGRYERDKDILADYINLSDFVPTMKSLEK